MHPRYALLLSYIAGFTAAHSANGFSWKMLVGGMVAIMLWIGAEMILHNHVADEVNKALRIRDRLRKP